MSNIAMQPDDMALDDARWRILRVNLEARLVVCEMRRAAANFELDSPRTPPEKRGELTAMRDAALVEWGEVMTELAAIREARGKEILPNRVQGSIGARVIPTL